MKKFLAFLLVVLMATAMFAACDVKETVVIGYTVYKPMNYTDDNGEFVGFDTDLAKAVFEVVGRKMKIAVSNTEKPKAATSPLENLKAKINNFNNNGG